MYFGVDYHPEQWVYPYGGTKENPEAEWEKAARGVGTIGRGQRRQVAQQLVQHAAALPAPLIVLRQWAERTGLGYCLVGQRLRGRERNGRIGFRPW